MASHASRLNSKENSDDQYDTIKVDILTNIYEDMKDYNQLAQEIELAGELLTSNEQLYENNVPLLIATINASVTFFEVAQITSDTETRNRIITYTLKHNNQQQAIPITDKLLEPLCYPLLFSRCRKPQNLWRGCRPLPLKRGCSLKRNRVKGAINKK